MVTDIAWGRSAKFFNEDFATMGIFCLCGGQAASVSQTSCFQDSWTFGCFIVRDAVLRLCFVLLL
jgi:hypothetical protein